MPVVGRKPKPDGQKRNRHQPTYDWVEVVDVPHAGGPGLPSRWTDGRAWPSRTKKWWAAISTMPHCALWSGSDWEYAIDTAYVHAAFAAGDVRAATELGRREKLLGNTLDSRRDLRIRYVPAAAQLEAEADVTRMDDYRTALG